MKIFQKQVSTISFHLREGLVEAGINGKALHHEEHGNIDLHSVEKSLKGNGIYYIWTCECGIPGCAGRENGVKVSNKGKLIYWNDIDDNKKYWLAKEQIIQALNDILKEVKKTEQTGTFRLK